MPEWNEQDQPAKITPQDPKTQETQETATDICPDAEASVAETN